MGRVVERGQDWTSLPVISTGARLLCRELTLQNEYLRLENQVLKEKVPRCIRFTDEKRRPPMRMSSARETAVRALWGTDEFLDRTRSRAMPRPPQLCTHLLDCSPLRQYRGFSSTIP